MREIPFMSSNRIRKKNIYDFFDENYEKISIIHLVTSAGVIFKIFNKRKGSKEIKFPTQNLRNWSDKLEKKALNTGKFVWFGSMLINKDNILDIMTEENFSKNKEVWNINILFKKNNLETIEININQKYNFESFLEIRNEKNIEIFMSILKQVKEKIDEYQKEYQEDIRFLFPDGIGGVKDLLYKYIKNLTDEEKLFLEIS